MPGCYSLSGPLAAAGSLARSPRFGSLGHKVSAKFLVRRGSKVTHSRSRNASSLVMLVMRLISEFSSEVMDRQKRTFAVRGEASLGSRQPGELRQAWEVAPPSLRLRRTAARGGRCRRRATAIPGGRGSLSTHGPTARALAAERRAGPLPVALPGSSVRVDRFPRRVWHHWGH